MRASVPHGVIPLHPVGFRRGPSSAPFAPEERGKKDRALAILDEEDLALSFQVLQEFYVQATHRTRTERLTHEEALALVESWLRFRVQEISVQLLRNAPATSARWSISYWDAAIVEAARESGRSTLLSEDLHDQMDFAGVRVTNPFL